LEWNALRPGDHVVVHDDADAELALHPGVVTIVQPVTGSNDIAVRVTRSGDDEVVVRPRRHAVHLLPIDEPCWRCDLAADHLRRRQERIQAAVS
jgi:hypothetical protein